MTCALYWQSHLSTDWIGFLIFALIAAISFLLGRVCRHIFARIPLSWLCDYGESPSDELLQSRREKGRFSGTIPFSLCFLCPLSLIYLQYGISLVLLVFPLCILALALLCVCDINYQILPDQFTALLLIPAVLFLIQAIFFGGTPFYQDWYAPLIGGVVGGLIWLIIDLAGRLVYKKDAIGFGDVKLFAAFGLIIGWQFLISTFLLTLLLAFVHSIILLCMKKTKMERYIPLAPYMCGAFLLVVSLKSQIVLLIDSYLSLF